MSCRKTLLLFGLALVVLAAVAAGCGGGGEATPEGTPPEVTTPEATTSTSETAPATEGGELTFARGFEPVSLNPLKTNGDNGSLWDMIQIFDPLVQYVPGETGVQPALAERWEVSDDGVTYTFHLRDAKFSDGTLVTSEDVKFSIDRYADPETNPGFAFLAESIKSSEAPDAKTVVITLKHPDGGFLDALAIPVAAITPKAYLEKVGDDAFGEQPIGTGPYMLKSWERGKVVELVRNPYYWQEGLPLLDAIHITYVANDTTRVLQVQEGQADIAEAVPFSQIEQLDAQDGVSVMVTPIWAYDAIWLNHKYEPLADKNVRQALAYALDKDAINNAVYNGKAEVANSTIAKVQYWDESVSSYPFDLEKAKQLMAASKFPDGFKLSFSVPAGDTVHRDVAVIAKDAWSQLGVDVQITEQETGALFTEYSKGNYQASIPLPKITSDVSVPDELALAWLQYTEGYQGFFTYYDNQQLGELVRQANQETDAAKREQLWKDVQRVSMEDAPWIPLFFVPAVYAVRDNVQNFRVLESGWWDLANTSLSE